MRLTQEQLTELARFNDLRIRHRQTGEVLDTIHNFHQINRYASRTSFMALSGETGTGKSSLVGSVIAQFPNSQEQTTILNVIVPERCTIKNIVHNILMALGDPNAHKGTRGEMEARIPKYTNALGVEMVVLDEFQHLISRRNSEIRYEVSDWLKSQANILQLPFLLVGLPGIEAIFEENTQLGRRISHNYRMEAFSLACEEEQKEFQLFLYFVEQKLPFPEASCLLEPAIVLAMMEATNGLIGYIMRLVYRAAELAMLEGSKALQKCHLARAYSELGGPDHRKKNPFDETVKINAVKAGGGRSTNIRGQRQPDTNDLELT